MTFCAALMLILGAASAEGAPIKLTARTISASDPCFANFAHSDVVDD